MDEVLINANQLENSVQSVAARLRAIETSFSVDPVLWRFQVPEWWRNDKGNTKKNYKRLGSAYFAGTDIAIESGALVDLVSSDDQWRAIAANVIRYAESRLASEPTQLDFLNPRPPKKLQPTRLLSPCIVAYSPKEDRINRILIESSVQSADQAIAAQVVVPYERLSDTSAVHALLSSIPTNDISSYFLWTPGVTEEQLLATPEALAALLRLIAQLADRGLPVAHQYGNYTIAALHDIGVSAMAHHLGWVDKGEPAEQQGFMLRACKTYAPGVRHTIRFNQATNMARHLAPEQYSERYCQCAFCSGAFTAGQHPLDLLLESQTIRFKNNRTRQIPTSRAVAANTWHYLLSRRFEVQAFSQMPAIEVIERDIDRAAALADDRETGRLSTLAQSLRSA
jgi:hypothetical protein